MISGGAVEAESPGAVVGLTAVDLGAFASNMGRGIGGGAASPTLARFCFLARADSCESEALRNLSIEKRRCLGVSSCIGGESGRSIGSRTGRVAGLSAAEGEDGLSWGGVTGGAGMAGVRPLAARATASAAASTSAEKLVGDRRRAGRSMWEERVLLSGAGSAGSAGSAGESSKNIVVRRSSALLAMMPRLLRRNGMVTDGGQAHQRGNSQQHSCYSVGHYGYGHSRRTSGGVNCVVVAVVEIVRRDQEACDTMRYGAVGIDKYCVEVAACRDEGEARPGETKR